jgi:hypothetical protein
MVLEIVGHEALASGNRAETLAGGGQHVNVAHIAAHHSRARVAALDWRMRTMLVVRALLALMTKPHICRFRLHADLPASRDRRAIHHFQFRE